MKWLVAIILAILWVIPVEATICTRTEVQNAIDAASSGDTVTLSAACTSTWASNVSIPNTKGITLDGNSAAITGAGVSFAVHATVGTRVTGFDFQSSTADLIINSDTSQTSAKWRVDHNTFRGSVSFMLEFGSAPGLFDHNTFTTLKAAHEFVHFNGWGAVSTTGWTTTAAPQGSADQIYVEDNTFVTDTAESNNAWLQSYYGSRVVMRYNSFTYTRWDNHGTGGNIGGRWFEYYNNTYAQTGGVSGYNPNIRAGSGIIFNNTYTGSFVPDTGFCEEDSGYPADYQVGRGQGSPGSQVLFPVYFWGNTASNHGSVNNGEASCVALMVALNRDVYRDEGASCTAGGACTSGVGTGTTLPTTCSTTTGFWKTDAGGDWDTTHGGANDGALYKCTATDTWTLYYTPYTYPHPLQGSTPETSAPAVMVLMRMILVFVLSISSAAMIPAMGNVVEKAMSR